MLVVAHFIATLGCTVFSGAAINMSLVEHPARMQCDTRTAATVRAASLIFLTNVLKGLMPATWMRNAPTSGGARRPSADGHMVATAAHDDAIMVLAGLCERPHTSSGMTVDAIDQTDRLPLLTSPHSTSPWLMNTQTHKGDEHVQRDHSN